jgi:hypothetical protein
LFRAAKHFQNPMTMWRFVTAYGFRTNNQTAETTNFGNHFPALVSGHR